MFDFIVTYFAEFALLVCGLLFLISQEIKNRSELRAIKERTVDRVGLVYEWIEANPHLNVSDHDYPRGLIVEHVIAYIVFIVEHRLTTDHKYIEFLIRLLNHKGTGPPTKRKTSPQMRRRSFYISFGL